MRTFLGIGICIVVLLTTGAASGVDWSGPGNSWDNGLNWTGDSKPTAGQVANFAAGVPTTGGEKLIYLNDNQVCDSLTISTETHIVYWYPENDASAGYYLTLSSGDITDSASPVSVHANLKLGDAKAVWNVNSDLYIGAATAITNYTGRGVDVDETVAGTDIEKTGTGVLKLSGTALSGKVATGNHLNITGTFYIREGRVETVGDAGGIGTAGKLFDIVLGNDTMAAAAAIDIGRGGTVYPDVTVAAGNMAKSIENSHGHSGGHYSGDFTLNDSLIVKALGPMELAGDWSGAGGVTKQGGGNAAFIGDCVTYSGTTVVEAGILFVNATTSGQGDYTVQSGAGLGGSGTIGLSASTITIDNGGHLLPGGYSLLRTGAQSVGTLTIDGDLLLDNDSQLDFQLGRDYGVDNGPGVSYDTIVLLSDLTLDGSLNVTQEAGFNTDNGIYELISGIDTLKNNGLETTGLDGVDHWIDTTQEGYVYLRTGETGPPEIPEPGTMLLLGTGVLGALGFIRRRRMK